MPVNGLSHITFVVSDLSRSARLWCEGLGASEVYNSGTNTFSLYPERFFLIGEIWIALMQGPTSERSYRHVAFEANENEFPEFERRLRILGVEIRPPRLTRPFSMDAMPSASLRTSLLALYKTSRRACAS